MTEPRWQLEQLRVRVPVPHWPLEPDLAAQLDAGLLVWASGVAAAAGAMVAGEARWAGATIIDGQCTVMYEVPVSMLPHAGAGGACPDYGSRTDPCPPGCASGTCVAGK